MNQGPYCPLCVNCSQIAVKNENHLGNLVNTQGFFLPPRDPGLVGLAWEPRGGNPGYFTVTVCRPHFEKCCISYTRLPSCEADISQTLIINTMQAHLHFLAIHWK